MKEKIVLQIFDDYSLPLEAATQTFAIVARKRVGKTYTASVMAEEFIKAGIPICVLDPTGAWWGLRSSADGKKEGFPVVIIGGAHGDVPLDEHSGKIIADLVVDHPGNYIIDFSQTESGAAQDRFATDFATHFYRRKEQHRFPMQLMIDEADCFIPEQPFPNQRKMLGAFDTIVRRGGIFGIGVTLITQRPAVLSKNVLTQAETLISLQISGIDQDAVDKHWIKRHGTPEQRSEMLGSLAGLPKGDAWLWSPSWLNVFKRVRARTRETFNSSATPEVGKELIVPKKLAAVDIAKLGERIKSAVEEQKQKDPVELRKRIKELEVQLSKQSKPVAQSKEKIVEKPVITKEQNARLTRLETTLEVIQNHRRDIENSLRQVAHFEKDAIEVIGKIRKGLTSLPSRAGVQTKLNEPPVSVKRRTETSSLPVGHNQVDEIWKPSKCQKRVLDVLATFTEGCGISKLAMFALYKVSGGFRTELSGLRSAGMIDGENDSTIRVTTEGVKFAKPLDIPDGRDERIDFFLSHPAFSKCQRAVITALRDQSDGLTIDELAPACDPPYAVSGGFRTELSGLRTTEIIVGQNDQRIKLNPEFFSE